MKKRLPNAKRSAAGTGRSLEDKAPMPRPAIWWAILLLAVVPLILSKIYVSDCWWHLQCGRSLMEHWRVPDFHSFYYTPVQP